jgi:hypothetical protein
MYPAVICDRPNVRIGCAPCKGGAFQWCKSVVETGAAIGGTPPPWGSHLHRQCGNRHLRQIWAAPGDPPAPGTSLHVQEGRLFSQDQLRRDIPPQYQKSQLDEACRLRHVPQPDGATRAKYGGVLVKKTEQDGRLGINVVACCLIRSKMPVVNRECAIAS